MDMAERRTARTARRGQDDKLAEEPDDELAEEPDDELAEEPDDELAEEPDDELPKNRTTSWPKNPTTSWPRKSPSKPAAMTAEAPSGAPGPIAGVALSQLKLAR
jgi:hypothetical protein